jgi:hypothetical protein
MCLVFFFNGERSLTHKSMLFVKVFFFFLCVWFLFYVFGLL